MNILNYRHSFSGSKTVKCLLRLLILLNFLDVLFKPKCFRCLCACVNCAHVFLKAAISVLTSLAGLAHVIFLSANFC